MSRDTSELSTTSQRTARELLFSRSSFDTRHPARGRTSSSRTHDRRALSARFPVVRTDALPPTVVVHALPRETDPVSLDPRSLSSQREKTKGDERCEQHRAVRASRSPIHRAVTHGGRAGRRSSGCREGAYGSRAPLYTYHSLMSISSRFLLLLLPFAPFFRAPLNAWPEPAAPKRAAFGSWQKVLVSSTL